MDGPEVNPSTVGFVEDRRSDGTFAPGHTVSKVTGGSAKGGQRAARKEYWRQMFDQACRGAISEERMLRIVNAAAEAAENGDIRAAHELLDRMLGKSDQYTESIVENVGAEADPEAVALLQQIARRHLRKLAGVDEAPGKN